MTNNTLKVVKNPSLLTIGIAESISGIGDWITMLAIFAILVFRGGGGVTQSSGVFLCGLVPTLVLSPFAGALCDRFDRKKLMILSQVVSGIVVSGLIFADNIFIIYALLALQAASMSVMTPARQSSIPLLVAPEDLTTANAFLTQLSSLVKIFAPMLAGLILSLVSPHTAIILDVVSFALSALMLTRLKSLSPVTRQETVKELHTLKPDLRTWFANTFTQNPFWKTMKGTVSLQMLFIAGFFSIFVIVGFDVLAAVFFRDTLKETESFYGLAIGLVGVGSLLSTLFLMLKKRSPRPWQDAVAGIALLSIIPLSLTLASSIHKVELARIVTLAACFVGGMGNGLLHVQISTLLQSFTPGHLLGEASGLLQSTMVTGQLLGTLLTPLLVPGVLSTGIFCLISFIALLVLVTVLVVQLSRNPERFSLPTQEA
jgi:MFS family permease